MCVGLGRRGNGWRRALVLYMHGSRKRKLLSKGDAVNSWIDLVACPCFQYNSSPVRDWSLITEGGGGATKQEGGGTCEVLLLRKVGTKKVLAMLKGGGGTTSFGVVFTQ